MEKILENSWYLIIFLAEIAAILYILKIIINIIGNMFGLSWKKVLMWAATVFGILWLKDYIKKRNSEQAVYNNLTEEDFEVINEE